MQKFDFVLCTGDPMLERVSSQVIVLDPPEKLVIETRASGGYGQFDWSKNGNPFTLTPGQPFTITLREFPNFFEIFVREPTTANDLGLYEVEDIGNTGPPLPEVQFAVTPYSKYLYKTLVFFSLTCALTVIPCSQWSFVQLSTALKYMDSWAQDYTASTCTDYPEFINIGL